MTSLTEAIVEIHDVLEAGGVRHALCGGIASNLYRDEVRATMDVDFYVAVGAAELVALTRTFEAAGWRAQPSWRGHEQLRLEREDAPRVDCLIATTDYEREALERAVRASVESSSVPVLAPEDLVVFKLVAGRARDYEAVAAMINTPTTGLDGEYIAGVMVRLGMGGRWERARDEAIREADVD